MSPGNVEYIVEQKFMKSENKRENEYIRNFLTDAKTPKNIVKMMDAKQQLYLQDGDDCNRLCKRK